MATSFWRPKKIIVCEDDPDTLAFLTILLEKEGHEVHSTTVAEKVWDILEKVQPDLVLMDIKVPEMGGLAATARLKSNEATNHLKVILVSGWQDLPSIAADMKADGYLAKPFDIHELRALVNQPALP